MYEDWFADHDRRWTPAIDIERENGHLIVRADAPGFKPDEVRIEVDDDILTAFGHHEETSEQGREDKDRHYVRRERRVGSFSRSLALPSGVDAKHIKATTHDGIVEVTVPLPKAAKSEPVTITPSSAS